MGTNSAVKGEKSYEEYYSECREESEEFADFICQEVRTRCGLIIQLTTSKRFQLTVGESFNAVEVKHDRRFRDTGNLYIETAEKSHPNRPNYSASGIHRRDNSFLWIIGDHRGAYLLAKRTLLRVESIAVQGRRGLRCVETPTSRGYLLPVELANDIAVTVFTFG